MLSFNRPPCANLKNNASRLLVQSLLVTMSLHLRSEDCLGVFPYQFRASQTMPKQTSFNAIHRRQIYTVASSLIYFPVRGSPPQSAQSSTLPPCTSSSYYPVFSACKSASWKRTRLFSILWRRNAREALALDAAARIRLRDIAADAPVLP